MEKIQRKNITSDKVF